MPYIPKAQLKAQLERSRWISLADLVPIIRGVDDCTVEDAYQQIRDALADGAIRPLKWEPAPPPEPPKRGRIRFPGYTPAPPGENSHWRKVKIDWENSRVFDNFETVRRKALIAEMREHDGPVLDGHSYPRTLLPAQPSKWRTLLFDREACARIWPQALNVNSLNSRQMSEAEAVVHNIQPKANESGRPTERDNIAQAFFALKEADEIAWNQPMTRLYPAIRKKITGAVDASAGLGDEAIRKVVSPLFKAHKLAHKSTDRP
jgi:hypothetical protein